MKKTCFPLMIMAAILAGCQTGQTNNAEYVEYSDYVEYTPTNMDDAPCDDGVSTIKYSVSSDGDLQLETRHHVIMVDGAPGKKYAYYVWAGDKTYADTPDLTVDENTITTTAPMPTQMPTE